jgi:hypothetical protein
VADRAGRSTHVYEVRHRKDKRGVDLICDALPFGRHDFRLNFVPQPEAAQIFFGVNGSRHGARISDCNLFCFVISSFREPIRQLAIVRHNDHQRV